MATLPALPEDPGPAIAALARRYRRAGGPVIALLNRLGGRIEGQLAQLPPAARRRIDRLVRAVLERSLALAVEGRRAPDLGPAAAPAVAALTGAVGGAGGLATAVAELPVTVTLILSAVCRAAEAAGFDPAEPAVRAEVLRVLADGGPLSRDDGVNTAFLGARLALTGGTVQKLLATVVPAFSAVLAQKLAAQTVPVLGALSGAAVNAAYLGYFRELAAVRFGLLALAARHGAERVHAEFARAAEPARVRQA
jgi:hypothetical protein